MSDTDPKSKAPAPEAADTQPEGEADATLLASETPPSDGDENAEQGDASASSPEDRIAELEASLAEALRDRLLALAEAENAGKRADKRISDNAKFATSNICKAILQVADNLERALLAAPEKLRVDNEVIKNLAVGVEMTAKELATVLEGQGVSKFVSLDQPFDPNQHQAMQEVERTDVPTGTVVQVVQEGYMMADRLLRPAMVVVSKGGPNREAPEANGEAGESGVNTEV